MRETLDIPGLALKLFRQLGFGYISLHKTKFHLRTKKKTSLIYKRMGAFYAQTPVAMTLAIVINAGKSDIKQ